MATKTFKDFFKHLFTSWNKVADCSFKVLFRATLVKSLCETTNNPMERVRRQAYMLDGANLEVGHRGQVYGANTFSNTIGGAWCNFFSWPLLAMETTLWFAYKAVDDITTKNRTSEHLHSLYKQGVKLAILTIMALPLLAAFVIAKTADKINFHHKTTIIGEGINYGVFKVAKGINYLVAKLLPGKNKSAPSVTQTQSAVPAIQPAVVEQKVSVSETPKRPMATAIITFNLNTGAATTSSGGTAAPVALASSEGAASASITNEASSKEKAAPSTTSEVPSVDGNLSAVQGTLFSPNTTPPAAEPVTPPVAAESEVQLALSPTRT